MGKKGGPISRHQTVVAINEKTQTFGGRMRGKRGNWFVELTAYAPGFLDS